MHDTKLTIPTHDPQTGELNPHYEDLTGYENPMKMKTGGVLKRIEDYNKVLPILEIYIQRKEHSHLTILLKSMTKIHK